ncbi:hypothetical protein [Marinagarivorans algicola]|uniref:hypothetical protein n=1 Tax=Marinagarivorans algicola TaxID=1513270 RepID=UPI0012E2909B|nr:hypothetical protein [Marinagarivorans algicola]
MPKRYELAMMCWALQCSADELLLGNFGMAGPLWDVGANNWENIESLYTIKKEVIEAIVRSRDAEIWKPKLFK